MPRTSEIQAALDWSHSRKIAGINHSIGDALADGYLELEAINAELLEVLKEVEPIGDISEGLAPYYIHSDTIKRIRAAITKASNMEECE